MAAAISRARSAGEARPVEVVRYEARPAAIRCSAWRAAICAWRRRSVNFAIGEPTPPSARRCFRLQHLESRPVDRLEGQQRLEPFDRCRVELAGGLERALAVDFDPVALEAQGPRPGRRNGPPGGRPVDRGQAAAAQRLGASPFQLPTWEGNPFAVNDLLNFLPQLRRDAAGCDRHDSHPKAGV